MAVDKTVAINITSKNTASPQLQQVNKDLAALGAKGTAAGAQLQGGMSKGTAGVQVLNAAMSKAGMGILPLQMGLVGLGAAAAGSSVLMVKSAIDAGISYESAFAGVRKTVDATEAEFAQFNAEIRRMATTIPATREEIAKVAEAAGQLGIKKEALMGFTRVMVDLGNTTNLTSQQAAMDLARLANITQMNQSEFDRLGSTVVDLGNKFATTEQDIVAMGLRLAGAGKTVGMTEAQILGFATALSSVGIEAESGGTAFSRVMLNIKAEIDSGGDKLERFAEVAGMSVDDFSRKFKTDAAGAIIAFIGGLGEIQRSGGDTIGTLDEVGLSEIRVRDAILRTLNATGLLTEATDTGTKAWKENKALTKEAEERYKTTASQIEKTKNKFSDLGVELFNRTKPAIDGTIEAFGNFAEMLTKNTLPAIEQFTKASQDLFKVQREHSGLIQILRGGLNALGDAAKANEELQARLAKKTKDSAAEMQGYAIRAFAAVDATWALNKALVGLQVSEETARIARNAAAQESAEDAKYLNSLYAGANIDPSKSAFAIAAQKKFNEALAETDRNIRLGLIPAIDDYDTRMGNADLTKIWERAAKEAERAAKEGERAGAKLETALDKADRSAERLERDMNDLAFDTTVKLGEIGERAGEKWIAAWFEADRAIKQAQQSAEDALRTLDQQEILNASIGNRRKSLDERLRGEDLVHRRAVDDQEARYEMERDLSRTGSEEERARIRERFGYWLEDVAHKRQLEDAEAAWRKGQEEQRAALEKELHEEEIDRRRAAIQEEMEKRIKAANDTWTEKQKLIAEETTKLQAEEVARAKAKLEAMKQNYFDQLPEAAQGAIDELRARLEAAFGAAIGMISGGGGGVSGVDPRHAPGGDIFEEWKRNEPEQYAAWAKEHGIPGFAGGGVVPGLLGAPQLVLAHGGERITPGGGADFDRLVRAIERLATRPIQIDGQTVARIVDTEQGYIRSIG